MQNLCLQIYISTSKQNVFRGLHYQIAPYQQEKLFTPLSGLYELYCVNTLNYSDIKKFLILPEDSLSLYVPKGWATGLYAKDTVNTILYCSPQQYNSSAERGISLKVIPELNSATTILSAKDQSW